MSSFIVLLSFVSSTRSASRLLASFGGPFWPNAEVARIRQIRPSVNREKYFFIRILKRNELSAKYAFDIDVRIGKASVLFSKISAGTFEKPVSKRYFRE
jgi:hypothetical protein